MSQVLKPKTDNKRYGQVGYHHSSVDSSAPTNLPPLVQIPSTPSLLLSFTVKFVLYLSCGRKNRTKQKEAEFIQFFKKRYGQGATLVYQCPQKDLSFNFCHPLPFCYFLNQLLLSLQQFGNLLQSLQLTCYAKTITNSSNFCSVYSDFFTNKGL